MRSASAQGGCFVTARVPWLAVSALLLGLWLGHTNALSNFCG